MSKRIVVAYATKTGSTAEMAEAIARPLCEAGLSAGVWPVTKVADLEGFSGTVLGSAVPCAAWLREMADFTATRRDALVPGWHRGAA
jgi:menaquinone-dependent protoporphyrinogen oxidase